MAKYYWEVQQGSLEWHKLRSGIPTASMFHKIITPAKLEISASRKQYACQLIAERLLRWQPGNLDNIRPVEDGKANEPLAVKALEFALDCKTTEVGFVTTDDGRIGASPDRVLGARTECPDCLVEVKSPTIPVQVRRLLFGNGVDYRIQVQGQLFVGDADKSKFFSHHPQTPEFLLEVGREDEVIRKLDTALRQFTDELDEWTEKCRHMGAWQEFAEVIAPTDVTYGARSAEELDRLLDEEAP